MERTKYIFFLVGAVLAAGAFAAIQLNVASGQAGGGVIPHPNATDTQDQTNDTTTAGNFTVTEEGLGNGTVFMSIPHPVNTTELRLHIDEASSALQTNDTQTAMQHIILALEEIEIIFGTPGTTTTTTAADNATSTAADATDMMTGNTTENTLMQAP